MDLKHLKEGVVMQLVDEPKDGLYQASFYEMHSDDSFFLKGRELYSAAARMAAGTVFNINFFSNESVCTFAGSFERVWIRGGAYLTLIKRISKIEEVNQRKSKREIIPVKTILYRISEEEMKSNILETELNRAELTCRSFDISVGGMCLLSNERLQHGLEPYYLAEFSLSAKDNFKIPSKIVRQGDAPQMVNYRHDYGLKFIYGYLPNEAARLSNALFSARMSMAGR